MYAIKNITTKHYVMMHSCYNGVNHTPETTNPRMAKRFSKKEAQAVVKQLNSNLEFKKYSVEKHNA